MEALVKENEGEATVLLEGNEGSHSLLPEDLIEEKPGTVIGRYKLVEKIGESGLGAVYLADKTKPAACRVVFKIIKPGMDSKEAIAQFEAEQQAFALTNNPNIAKVLDSGTSDSGRPYFVIELITGIPMTQFCKEKPLDMRQRLALFLDVCSAVHHAHQKGIIHRRLNPSNILVAMDGNEPVPKVIDFGIARKPQQPPTDKTQIEHFTGAPVYLSPEETALEGLDIDTRSDIYSLGVLLYELLTGRPPFDPKKLISSGHEHRRRAQPPKPSERLSEVSDEDSTGIVTEKLKSAERDDLDWIVMKAIAKDRALRYETANGFAQDIRRFLNDEPIVERVPSTVYKLRKLSRSRKIALGVAAMIGMLLIAGIMASTWFATSQQASRVREKEVNQKLVRQLEKTEAIQTFAQEQLGVMKKAKQKLEFELSERHLEVGETGLGLAYLARMIRDDPEQRMAAERLTSILIHRNFPVPPHDMVRLDDGPSSINEVYWSRFSLDGRFMMSSVLDSKEQTETLRLWETQTGKLVGQPIVGKPYFNMVKLSSDGERVVTLLDEAPGQETQGVIQIWEAQSGLPIGEPIRPIGRRSRRRGV